MQIRHFVKLTAIVLFVLIIANPTAYCADVAKIGVVNFQKILENSEAGKAANKELNNEGKTMKADLEQRNDVIKELQQMLERDAGVLTKEAREEKQWELNRKIDEFKALEKKYSRKIQELQMQLVAAIRQDLVMLIRDYGQKNGYLMILEDTSVVYAPQSIEISDEIIRLYNQDYSQKGGKSQGPKQ